MNHALSVFYTIFMVSLNCSNCPAVCLRLFGIFIDPPPPQFLVVVLLTSNLTIFFSIFLTSLKMFNLFYELDFLVSFL